MRSIHIDFETYSEACIKQLGAWAYAAHPTTEVICMAYAVNGEDLHLLTNIRQIKQTVIDFMAKPDIALHAWNSFFEMAICANVLGIPEALDPAKWVDTAAHAAALAMPRALGDCGAALGIAQDKQKDKRGRYLIQRVCKPNRGKRIQDADLLKELYDYCQQDVVAEREIAKRLRPLSPLERQVWELDQRINARGVTIDTDNVNNALAI